MSIVPEEAEVVKEIFAACLAGKGTLAIAKELNDKGIKAKKNGKWYAGSIKNILTNEKYTGDVIFQKTYTDDSLNRHINYGERDRFLCKDHHEPIISHEDFEKVRAVLNQRAIEKGNGTDTYRYQNRYCFSGKIKCGECGTTFKRRQHYKPSGNYVAWTCETHLENKEKCRLFHRRTWGWQEKKEWWGCVIIRNDYLIGNLYFDTAPWLLLTLHHIRRILVGCFPNTIAHTKHNK